MICIHANICSSIEVFRVVLYTTSCPLTYTSVKVNEWFLTPKINKLQCSHKSEIVPTAIKFGLTHILDEISLVKN